MAIHPSLVPFRCCVEFATDSASVSCHGRLLRENIGEFKDVVRPLIARCRRIVLDLSDVDFMDSAGLGALVGLKASAVASASCTLEFANFPPQLKELLETTMLGHYLGVR